MSTTKSKVFDTDYYSASVYEEEAQGSGSTSKQVLFAVALFALVALGYFYFSKDKAAPSPVVTEESPSVSVSNEVAKEVVPVATIKEEVVAQEVAVEEKIMIEEKVVPEQVAVEVQAPIEEKTLVVTQEVAVETVPSVEKEVLVPEVVSSEVQAKNVSDENVLTAEYIKQVQESLGNY